MCHCFCFDSYQTHFTYKKHLVPVAMERVPGDSLNESECNERSDGSPKEHRNAERSEATSWNLMRWTGSHKVYIWFLEAVANECSECSNLHPAHGLRAASNKGRR
jgi:hypothetical protein